MDVICRKQAWCWMQGDLHRAKQKDLTRYKDRHGVSKILSGVDDMRIDDIIDNNYSTSDRLGKFERLNNKYASYDDDQDVSIR